MRGTIEQRLVARMKRSPSGCWEWQAYKNRYGIIRVSGKSIKAHRVAYSVWVGEIPTGLSVLHHCDNSGCINPDHLFLGTQDDNVQDMISKKRHVFPNAGKGEDHPSSILTDAKVVEIRQRARDGEVQRRIAEHFQISYQHCSDVIRRKCWKHA